jgi:hypothetical protein
MVRPLSRGHVSTQPTQRSATSTFPHHYLPISGFAMSAKQFLADAEGGVVPVDSHEKVLWIAFIYMDEGLWDGNGVFDVVEKLHACGWSFGEGGLRFNRYVPNFPSPLLALTVLRSLITTQQHPGHILPRSTRSSHLPRY